MVEQRTTGGGIRAHRRQFVITPRGYRAAPDWVDRPLACGLILSHCPELRVTSTRDASGGEWVVLGHAVSVKQGVSDPLAPVASAAPEVVPELTHSWTGRWLLIGPDGVWPDASALLGCLWGRDSAGELVVTSSPALGAIVGQSPARRVCDADSVRIRTFVVSAAADPIRRPLPPTALTAALPTHGHAGPPSDVASDRDGGRPRRDHRAHRQ